MDEKLAILRRLQRQYVAKSLPRTHSETTVEQSFNEQLFAKVLDYRTLLSHDQAEYHLRPKTHHKHTGRFDDFSLGYFSATRQVVIASAELKKPGVNLTNVQSDPKYDGLTPVQQALRAVETVPSCQWVIVCNYKELRLYERTSDHRSPPDPIALFDLLQVQDGNDLALLCAHFDRRALLGESLPIDELPRSELMAALDPKSPAAPLNGDKKHPTIVLSFTPPVEEDFALFRIERLFRGAVEESSAWQGLASETRFELDDGYIIVSAGKRCKVTMGGPGQLQLSVAEDFGKDNPITSTWLVSSVGLFMQIVDGVFGELIEGALRAGRVSAQLLNVKDRQLEVSNGHESSSLPRSGKAMTDLVVGTDFAYTPRLDRKEVLMADVVSELAVFFRSEQGKGGVAVDREKVMKTKMVQD